MSGIAISFKVNTSINASVGFWDKSFVRGHIFAGHIMFASVRRFSSSRPTFRVFPPRVLLHFTSLSLSLSLSFSLSLIRSFAYVARILSSKREKYLRKLPAARRRQSFVEKQKLSNGAEFMRDLYANKRRLEKINVDKDNVVFFSIKRRNLKREILGFYY